MTTIVVVVIDIYLYSYYYLNSHAEMIYGSLPSGPAASCATVVVVSRGRSWLNLHKNRTRPFRFARFPFRALGYGPVCPRRCAVPVPAPFVPFPGVPEPFLALRSLEGPRLPVSPGRRPFGRHMGASLGPVFPGPIRPGRAARRLLGICRRCTLPGPPSGMAFQRLFSGFPSPLATAGGVFCSP